MKYFVLLILFIPSLTSSSGTYLQVKPPYEICEEGLGYSIIPNNLHPRLAEELAQTQRKINNFVETVYHKNRPHIRFEIHQRALFAINEALHHDIPAGPNMAQAILETGYFTSNLYLKSRNEFCRKKPKNYKGDLAYYKDDDYIDGVLTYSPFMKFETSEQSWKDHSNHLTRTFPKTIGTKSVSEYFAGLQGYATDDNYTKSGKYIFNTLKLGMLDEIVVSLVHV